VQLYYVCKTSHPLPNILGALWVIDMLSNIGIKNEVDNTIGYLFKRSTPL